MSHAESTPSRAVSRDGTDIAYWTTGNGPPLVLVHGAPADHTRWRPLLPYLEPHATTHAIDRRGRGASGDGPEYALDREYEDVAAVVDAVAGASGSVVDVYGHSVGGLVAFGAATLTSNMRKLVLYEGWPVVDPAVSWALPDGLQDRLDALLAEGDRDEVVATLFREVEAMSDEDLDAFRAAPSWPGRVAAAAAITRELRAVQGARLDPETAAKITVPVLLLTGDKSSDPGNTDIDAVAATLPDARIVILEGHEHVADVLAPEYFADRLVALLRD
jgi:pimeloyl-ACP methyl ester carboxylesterase